LIENLMLYIAIQLENSDKNVTFKKQSTNA